MFLLAPNLLFAVAILGLGMALETPVPTVAAIVAFTLGLYLTYRRGFGIGRRTETLISFVMMGLSLVYSSHVGEELLYAFQYWLVGILVLRAYRRMEKRDYAFCMLVSAGLFAHVGRIYSELPFLLIVLLNLAIAPYALFQYQVRFGNSQPSGGGGAAAPFRFRTAQIRFMGGISFILLLAACGIFMVIPRASTGLVFRQGPERTETRRVGYANSVKLGSFSRISEQRDTVMLVESDKPAMWRGAVLDYFEGGAWWETSMRYCWYYWRGDDKAIPAKPNAPETTRHFTIIDVRRVDNQLFSAGNVVDIKRIRTPRSMWINDIQCTLAFPLSELKDPRVEYELVSQDGEYIGVGTLSEVKWRIIPGRTMMREEDFFVQVPAEISARTRALAVQITQGAESPEAKADAVKQYLNANCAYSTEGLNSGNEEPIDYFLFTSKRGHCEYFATAMAIMLRCAGVKTRVVQGFAPGIYVDGRHVVRQCDAHLWMEVFHPGKGWKSYDPTPPRLELEDDTVGLMERLKLQWLTYVVQYDRTVQLNILGWIKTASGRLATGMKAFTGELGYLRGLVFIAGLAGIMAFAVWRVVFRGRRTGRRRIPGRGPNRRMSGCFARYLKELEKRGYERMPGTTPNDLIAALERDKAPVLDAARRLTDLFYRTRFGGAVPTTEDEQTASHSLRAIRTWTRVS